MVQTQYPPRGGRAAGWLVALLWDLGQHGASLLHVSASCGVAMAAPNALGPWGRLRPERGLAGQGRFVVPAAGPRAGPWTVAWPSKFLQSFPGHGNYIR